MHDVHYGILAHAYLHVLIQRNLLVHLSSLLTNLKNEEQNLLPPAWSIPST